MELASMAVRPPVMRTPLVIVLCFALLGCIDGSRPEFPDGAARDVDSVGDDTVANEVDGFAIDLVDTKLVVPDTRLVDTAGDAVAEVESAIEVDAETTLDAAETTAETIVDATETTAETIVDATETTADTAEVVLACGPGCECESCDGDCSLNCAGGCGCDLDCSDNDGSCEVACKDRAHCTIDCQGANNCEVECKGRSECNIDCRGANNCKPLHCRDDAVCHIDCRGANNCDELRCDGRARCYLRCDPNDDCGCSGATSCGDGVVACNGAPCEDWR